jgi:sodium pump decarboxylase gamma subunit
MRIDFHFWGGGVFMGTEINGWVLTLVGITVVFVSLILLSFAIVIISKLVAAGNILKSTDTEKRNEEDNVTKRVKTKVIESTDDDKLVAVLTAAIMASMGNKPDCKIRVKSFRRIPQTSPAWNLAGRYDYISEKL